MLNRFVLTVLILFSSVFGTVASAAEAGPTVLITGANRGIGLELAVQLKAQGYDVIGTARKPAAAEALNALQVRVEQLDVADPASVQALAERLEGVPIDLLINNAGMGGEYNKPFREMDLERFDRVFAVNSTGPVRVIRALLDNLSAGKNKQVVNIGSIMASIEKNWGGSYSYRASKTALNMLNSSMAKELGKEGFTLVVLHPGWVKTRMGGEYAPVEVEDSVAGLVKVIAGLKTSDNGKFYDYEGKPIPW